MLDAVRAAEDNGVDTVIYPDHVVMGNRLDRYPWGRFRFAPDEPWLEPLTVLAMAAAVTSRIRVSTGVLLAPLRPAAVLAKTAATLDVMSRGRLELGVGTGWQREEYEAVGLDFETRAQRLDDTIAACQTLWTTGPATFTSPTVAFTDIRCDPRPVQPGGPPILFSGPLTKHNLHRIRTMGTGWIPIMGATTDDIRAGVERIREVWTAARRDTAALRVRAPIKPRRDRLGQLSLEATLAGAGELVACGVTEIGVPMVAFVRDPDEITPWLAGLGKAWEAAL
jgi:probable F420-dependent oxidoreductase